MNTAELCAVVDALNRIWWEQAAICFVVEVTDDDELNPLGWDLWFEQRAPFPNGVDANGVYAGPHEMYSLDRPILRNVDNPAAIPAARTSAHELGHGLGLAHQNCGRACLGLLMTSGTMGFQVENGSPASVNEVARARDAAQRVLSELSLEPTERFGCPPALLPSP